MSSIAFPTLPRLAKVRERLMGFGATLTPALGGPVQEVTRLGARFALDVELPPLGHCAGDWLAAQLKAKTLGQTLTLAWPKPAAAGSYGSPVVNGAGQAGSTLDVAGLTPSITVPVWTFFSYAANGRHYLQVTTDASAADGSGHATLSIAPMLRYPPTNGGALEFAAPVIEGLLDGPTVEWDLEFLRVYGARFSLSENE